MLLRKIVLLFLIIISLNLAIFIHPVFFAALLFFLHLLFNWTDFFYRENSLFEETDLSELMDPDAGPIEIINESKKCLIFVHGFPSTPKTYKYVAPLAEKAGYDVFAPLLPGFGTSNEDFIKSNFTQWFMYLRDFYLEKRRGYDKVYIVGLSMGGALTLKLAETYSGTWLAPDGISVNAAPVSLRFPAKGFARGAMLFSVRTISWFIGHQNNRKDTWRTMEDGHGEWLGYEGVFPRQIYSLKMGLVRVRKDLKKITVPIIAFQVPGDRTVDSANLTRIEKHVSSSVKSFHMLDYSGYRNTSHALFLYESIREKLMTDILDFFDGLQ